MLYKPIPMINFLKTSIYILLFSIFFNTHAQQTEKPSPSDFMVGTWLLEKVVKDDIKNDINQTVTFNKDGKIYMQNRAIGIWKYHPQQHKLFLNTGNLNGAHQIIENKDHKLILKLNNTLTYFIKINPEKIRKDNTKSGLKGVWQLSQKIDDNSKLFLRFLLPDQYVLVEKTDQSISTTKGEWQTNEQHKTLNLTGRLDYFKGKNLIIKISNSLLILKNNNRLFSFNKLPKLVDIEQLLFSQEDFFDTNDHYKYEKDIRKLPWQNNNQIFSNLSKIKQLTYQYGELVNEINRFDTKILKANVVTNMNENNIKMDDIFNGFDRNALPEDTAMPVVKLNEYNSPLFPFDDNIFRVVKQNDTKVPAGHFFVL